MLAEIVKKPEVFLVSLLKNPDSVKRLVNQNPGVALAALREVSGSGSLSLSVQARALEEILVHISSNPERVRQLLNDHLTSETQAEMIAVMGDRPSVACQVVGFETLLAALEMDVSKDFSSRLEPCLLLRAWAMNLKDRPEWEDELEMEIGGHSLKTWLVFAVFQESGCDLETLTPDMWFEVGLEPDEALEVLQRLEAAADDSVDLWSHWFSELNVAQARQRLRERTQTFEEQTSPSTIRKIAQKMDV
ncbi:hypothetical protein HYV70_03915 [Candidatus Uhrbacteria bacterium]|nr:hypothetical protein [Candidatus Uhrbacteria bacterium]